MTRKRVVCAVMLRKGKVMLARRAPGEKHAGCWEFPGGKVEPNETDAQALGREIYEEFGVRGEVGEHVHDSLCVYADMDLEILLCAYIFVPEHYDFDLRVHDKAVFFAAGELDALGLTAADKPIARAVTEKGYVTFSERK